MPRALRLSQKVFDEVLASEAIARAVEAKARRVAARTQVVAAQAGRTHMATRVEVVTGVRPGIKARYGARRPYARVQAELTDEERAADNEAASLTARQVLRRSARG